MVVSLIALANALKSLSDSISNGLSRAPALGEIVITYSRNKVSPICAESVLVTFLESSLMASTSSTLPVTGTLSTIHEMPEVEPSVISLQTVSIVS